MPTKETEHYLYTGMTSNLPKRVWEHKNKVEDGFTKQYDVDKLMYFETYDDVNEATKREQRLKRWNRDWKLALIEKDNPNWVDLYEKICK